jgi:WD40 repeat protein
VNAVDATWDACIRTIPVYNCVYGVAFSPKGTMIAALGWHRVQIFDAITGARLPTVDEQQSITTIAFSLDDTLLASGLEQGIVSVLDVQAGDLIRTFQGHTNIVRSVAFSPCGNMIASGADDNTIRIWNISMGWCECCLEGHSRTVSAVCWSETGDRVISGSDDSTIRVWSVSSRTCSSIIPGYGMLTSVAIFHDFIASGSWNGRVNLYDSGSGDVVQTISANTWIDSVQFSTHGDKIMYTHGNSASVWDLGTKTHLSTIRYNGHHARFSPDGTRVASGSDNFVKIWKSERGDSDSNAVDHHFQKVMDFHFALDGQLVACRSHRDVKTWDIKICDTTSGECLLTFDSVNIFPYSIVFSPNSAFLAFPSVGYWSNPDKKLLSIWNIRSRRLVNTVDYRARVVALSLDGTQIAFAEQSTLELWSTETGECLARQNLSQRINKVAFDVDEPDVLSYTTYASSKTTLRISPASSAHRDFSTDDESASLPMVLTPIEEESSTTVPAPSQSKISYYKEGDEWITTVDRARILWVPPDKRNVSPVSVQGNKAALGTTSGRVYIIHFPSAFQASSLTW